MRHHENYTNVEDLGGPVVGVAGRETHLGDLEPAGRRSNGGGSIVNLGHVNVDRAPVVSLHRSAGQLPRSVADDDSYLRR